MTEPTERSISPDQLARLEQYAAGHDVLVAEGESIRVTVDALNLLSVDEADRELMPAVATVATSPEVPALQAVEVLPLIHKAVEPFQPRQLNPETAANTRWTLDWAGVKNAINERIQANPEAENELVTFFLTTGSPLIETTYAPEESRAPLYVVTGGANDQSGYRPALSLASMASPEFRREHGLETIPERGLKGEDSHEAGWLGDQEFVTDLRNHVAERIANGEIQPRTLVLGSADLRRVLKGKELELATSKYIAADAEPLYPDRGLTEADNMLAGAIRVFGGDPATVTSQNVPSSDPEVPNKLITFESTVGTVTFLAAVGSDANISSQVQKAYQARPELFEGIDGLYGTTTAIYAWNHRMLLNEAAHKIGWQGPTEMLGLSAHAAGINRELPTLVGEATNYLRSSHEIALRALTSAEQYALHDLATFAIRGVQDQSQ